MKAHVAFHVSGPGMPRLPATDGPEQLDPGQFESRGQRRLCCGELVLLEACFCHAVPVLFLPAFSQLRRPQLHTPPSNPQHLFKSCDCQPPTPPLPTFCKQPPRNSDTPLRLDDLSTRNSPRPWYECLRTYPALVCCRPKLRPETLRPSCRAREYNNADRYRAHRPTH